VSAPSSAAGSSVARHVMNQMLDRGTLGDDRAIMIMLAAYEGLSA
jgi:hypothetical protein